jgi:SNF2 family DNA or RNA helicase
MRTRAGSERLRLAPGYNPRRTFLLSDSREARRIVEQPTDRTHRIGQTRRVIATRLVARSTIEEKILELQAAKRSLADAILSADEGVLSAIGREELELLLG